MSKHFKFSAVIVITMLISTVCFAGGGYKLVWEDQFDGDKINHENWGHMIGDGALYGIPDGWGNHELQYYTERKENSYIEDGKLVLAAKKEDYQGMNYTSARVVSHHRKDLKYGKIEARIKLPSGKGQWCAFWMMPTDSAYGKWPLSGEIDILEATNASPDRVMSSIFYGAPWPGMEHISRFSEEGWEKKGDLSQEYHVYTLEWQPYEMRWYFDGRLYSAQNKWFTTAAPYPAPFDKEFYLLFNIAVGGSGPGDPDETTVWPMKMYVDWVKVYQSDNLPPMLKILSPKDNANVPAGKPIEIKVEALDVDGSIDRVEFYDESDELIGKKTSPPYTLNWDTGDGCYKVTVKAYDNDDFVNAAHVTLTKGVGCPQLPYHGKAMSIPGRIEAEDFDKGIQDEAYHDSDRGNNGGQYRKNSDVDIVIGEKGAGYALGWMMSGEWLEYAVNVAKSGSYDVKFRVASEPGTGKFRLEFDGVAKTDALEVGKTGGWESYTDIVVKGVELEAGEHIMKFFVVFEGLNLDYIEFTPASK
ncbi:MAG: family 16 glycosylhydrolase [Planctomycetes bacterium]|nr:family 16 glycosylhydrolase [Planctomycetota bacterium]